MTGESRVARSGALGFENGPAGHHHCGFMHPPEAHELGNKGGVQVPKG